MIYSKNDKTTNIKAETYELAVAADSVAVLLGGEQVTLLRPASAVNVTEGENVTADSPIGELSSDEGCYNAWGLKLDFAFFQPTGREAQSHSGKYGVELLLEYITLIYDCAKAVKPEAVISASPCHPLFSPCMDHARLHDYHPDLRRVYEEFSFRRNIYSIALPDALIDTDGASFSSRRDTMRHMRLAPTLGIPDLYCITPLSSSALTDSDWAEVAEIWREYDRKTDKIFK